MGTGDPPMIFISGRNLNKINTVDSLLGIETNGPLRQSNKRKR